MGCRIFYSIHSFIHSYNQKIVDLNAKFNNENEYLCAAYMSIIQSSGAGKTRLAWETIKLFPGIFFEFRKGENGYPSKKQGFSFFNRSFGLIFNE